MSEDHAQQNTDAEETPSARRGRDELGASARSGQGAAGEEPDVSELEVDRITLEEILERDKVGAVEPWRRVVTAMQELRLQNSRKGGMLRPYGRRGRQKSSQPGSRSKLLIVAHQLLWG